MVAPQSPSGGSLVSVVVAAFNAEKFLAAALDSIVAQDHSAIEIVVVNDGSTDATAEIAQSYGDSVRYFAQRNRGLGAAHNQGLALATGEYISFLDADDLWLPSKTSLELAALRAQPDVDMVFSYVEQFVTPSADGTPVQQLPERLRIMPGYNAASMLISRAAFDRVGGFDEKVILGPFIEWYMRAQERGLRVHVVDEVLMRRRIHDTNMGVRLREHRGDYLRILKAGIDRRRSAGDAG